MSEKYIVCIYFNMFDSISIKNDVGIKSTPWFFKLLHNTYIRFPYIILKRKNIV